MSRHHAGKQVQESITNGNENSYSTTPRTSEIRVNEKRRYKKRVAYQEMNWEKKQTLLTKNRARKQLKTGDSSNNPIPNALARSNIVLVSDTPLQIDVTSSTPHDSTESLHGVQTSRKRIYNNTNTVPPVTTQYDNNREIVAPIFTSRSEDTFDEEVECSNHSSPINPVFNCANGHDPYDFVYHGLPSTPRLLKEPTCCTYCGAKKFQYEFPTFCCMNGKTKLASSNVPNELYYLFTTRDRIGVDFRRLIRSYNTHFSFTSFGVKDAKRKNKTNYGGGLTNEESNCGGVYNFRVHGQIYHFIDQLVPREGRLPEYLQLYFYDTESEVDHRVQRMPNLDRNIVKKLMVILSNNPYSKVFRSLGELQTLDTCGITLNASVELDQRVYNKPSSSQVAAVWVEGNGDIKILDYIEHWQ